MAELGPLLTILIWLLIAGVIIWAIQAISATLPIPRVIVVIAQVVVAIVFLVMLLRLIPGVAGA